MTRHKNSPLRPLCSRKPPARVWIFPSREVLEALWGSVQPEGFAIIGVTIHQAAHYAGLSDTAFFTLLTRLVNKGLLARVTRKHPTTGKTVQIYSVPVGLVFDHSSYIAFLDEALASAHPQQL